MRILPPVDTGDGTHTFTYPRRVEPDADVLYRVESSIDLSPESWEAMAAGTVEVEPDGYRPGIDRVRVTLPPPYQPRVFLRIRADLNAP